MTTTEAERMRTLLREVDFPEPRHDLGHTMRLGRRRRYARWTAAAGAAVLVGAAAFASQVPQSGSHTRPAGPTPCAIEHLTLPAGVESAVASGVDPTGRFIIGWTDDERSILWTDGQPQILPADARNAEAVNPSGVVVGSVTTGAGSHAWVFRDGRVDRLPVPADSQAEMVSINDAGDIAGTVNGAAPIVWPADRPGTYKVFDAPEGASARAIGDGVVVGGTKSAGPYQWDREGNGKALATLPGLRTGTAVDVAGIFATGVLQPSADAVNGPPGGLAAVRWDLTTGQVTPIGVDALPNAVDVAGQVLIPESPPRLIGLDNVVRPLPPDPGFHRVVATGMTDNGIVVGYAATNDKDPNAGPYRSQPLRWTC